jgi:hypothetical protein
MYGKPSQTLTISSIALGQQRVENQAGRMPNRPCRIRLISPRFWLNRPLKTRMRDEARHRVGQEQHQPVGALEGQRFPVQQHRQQHAQRRWSEQHRQSREDHGPDEDADEGLAKAAFAEDRARSAPGPRRRGSRAAAVAIGAGEEAGGVVGPVTWSCVTWSTRRRRPRRGTAAGLRQTRAGWTASALAPVGVRSVSARSWASRGTTSRSGSGGARASGARACSAASCGAGAIVGKGAEARRAAVAATQMQPRAGGPRRAG